MGIDDGHVGLPSGCPLPGACVIVPRPSDHEDEAGIRATPTMYTALPYSLLSARCKETDVGRQSLLRANLLLVMVACRRGVTPFCGIVHGGRDVTAGLQWTNLPSSALHRNRPKPRCHFLSLHPRAWCAVHKSDHW